MKHINISFPGGKRVDAHYDGRTVHTDQSVANGGEGSAPEPFDLFWVSQATCMGIYALEFCTTRDLSTEGLSLDLKTERDPQKKMYTHVNIEITLPEAFPEKYHKAILRAVNLCAVKKHMLEAPTFEVTLKPR